MLISSSYLPPVYYFEKLLGAEKVVLESREHFIKQTIRNRCHILSPNGTQPLIVPVMHQNRTLTAMQDILIANDQLWQRQHWRSLMASYRRSAYFEFYMDDFAPFYHQPYKYLMEFNTGLLNLILGMLKHKVQISFTDNYVAPGEYSGEDFRNLCDCGLPAYSEKQKSYPQVFGYKSGFTGGLSVVDLLFNMGPASKDYLIMKT